MNHDIQIYFSGKKLYGDNFSINEIKEWFSDEAEGYANLGAKEEEKYYYAYHQLNIKHGFSNIKNKTFNNVLGIGSAYGDEFKPIISRIDNITIIDPSRAFCHIHEIMGKPCKYIKPDISGKIPFESEYFDLITSLGVMHHIPNVTYVIEECYRSLQKGGIMLIREPIHSMGDWRKPRKGLTKRERGIPLEIFEQIILNTGFEIKNKTPCIFPLLPKLMSKVRVKSYNNKILTSIDSLLSYLFAWNNCYHRTSIFTKLAPSSVYFVLQK